MTDHHARCKNCEFYLESQSRCDVLLPPHLARLVGGGKSPYDVPPVDTHPEWSCALHRYDDEAP